MALTPDQVRQHYQHVMEQPLVCPRCEHYEVLYLLSVQRGKELQTHCNGVVDENRALVARVQALFCDNIATHSRAYEMKLEIDKLRAQLMLSQLKQ